MCDISNGTHASANKEAKFINADLSKVQSGYVAVSPLEAVNTLHNLWLSTVAVIPQVGRRPRIILYFIWIRLNDISKRLSPMESMFSGGALHHILKQVLTTNRHRRPVYISKVDLADTYMRLWLMMEDVLSVDFLVPKKNPSDTQLVEFHLSLPMGYVDNVPYFFMETDTVADLANKAIS